jgi:hypothetical protein
MRFWCECGEVLSNSQNMDIDFRIYSDKEWLAIAGNESITSPLLIPYPEHTAWLCPKCKRIHIWKTEAFNRVALYELVEKAEDTHHNN